MTALLLRPHEVRPLLEGTATRFARVLKPQPTMDGHLHRIGYRNKYDYFVPAAQWTGHGYHVGDRLVCKEAWNLFQCSSDGECSWPVKDIPKEDPRPDAYRSQIVVDYKESPAGYDTGGPWRSPATMPAWASRLTLIVEDVDVMRVQDVTEEMAKEMGTQFVPQSDIRRQAVWSEKCDFLNIWNATNPKHPWESNPWIVTCRTTRHIGE